MRPVPNKQPVRTPATQILPSISNNLTQGSFTFVFQPTIGETEEITLVTNPEEFVQTETSTSNVVLTAGDIFSDSFGPGLTNIRIAGTFGQRPKINGQVGSGQLEILKLRNLFRKYLDELNPIVTPSASRNAGAKLMFFNPKDNEFWQIEPVGNYFILKRSKASPFLYRYEIMFAAISRVNNSQFVETLGFYSNVQDQVTQINADTQTLIDRCNSDYQDINKTMRAVNPAGFLPANALLEGVHNTRNFFQDNVYTPLSQLNAAVSNFLSATTQVINFPLQTLNSIAISCGAILGSMNFLYSSAASGFVYDPEFADILTNTILRVNRLKLYSNSFVKTFLKSDFIDQTNLPVDLSIQFVDLSQVQSSSYFVVRSGDTIESIALATLGSTDQWRTIAEFNGLAYPYISTNGEERTLGPGDKIAVPSTEVGSLANNIILGQSVAPPTADFSLGEDLVLDTSGDISITTTYDLQTVTGIENMKQAINLKLNIKRGELLVHPDFGVTDLRGYRTVPLLAARAKSELESTILSDSRVSGLTTSTVSIESDIVNYKAEINTKFVGSPIVLTGTF